MNEKQIQPSENGVVLSVKQAYMAKVALERDVTLSAADVAREFDLTEEQLEEAFRNLQAKGIDGDYIVSMDGDEILLTFDSLIPDEEEGESEPEPERSMMKEAVDEELLSAEELQAVKETREEKTIVQRIGLKGIQKIIIPAAGAFRSLPIPNDLSDGDLQIFLDLLATIKNLEESVRLLASDNAEQEKEIQKLEEKLLYSLPLWKKAWNSFVVKFGEGAGSTLGKGTVFAAGFIAGTIYSSFTEKPLGFNV